MRTHVKALALLIVLTTSLAGSGARADHGADAAGWLEQAGNGSGGNAPALAGFNVGTVLYDANRFPIGAVQRPSWPKFLAWGTIRAVDLDGADPAYQLSMSRGGDDALNWSRPAPAFIRDQDGNDVPFVLSHHGGFAVAYQSSETYPFIVVYRRPTADPYSRGQAAPPLNTVNAVHVALSEDGVHWVNDRAIEETLTDPVIEGAASTSSFKRGIDAPSDLIVNPAGSTSCTSGTPAVNFPWNCRFVMVYTALGVGDARSVALAGSGGISTAPDSLGQMLFRGLGFPVLGTGGTWDSAAVGHAHIRKAGATYVMTYSGASGAPTCVSGTMYCYQLGQATSANGLLFARANVASPMTPTTLLDQFDASQPSSLVNAQVVGPPSAGHIRAFYTRMTGTDEMFQGFTSPAIGTAPRMRIGMPDNGVRTTAITPIELYIGDDLGANPGLNATTLDVRIDGIPVNDLGASISLRPTLVGTYFLPGIRVSSSGTPISLPDGPHSFSARILDRDGEVGQISTSFVVDTTPPQTQLLGAPASPAVGSPVASMGTFTARTTDVGSSIQRVRVLVQNPLGMRKVYDSLTDRGFTVTEVTPQHWEWHWVAPVIDVHLTVPGEYVVSLHGVDAGGANEAIHAGNSTRLIVI